MGMTIDDVLEEIGSFGRYQLRLLVLLGFMQYMASIQVVISTFLSPEPPWRCRENSTVCNLIGNFKPGDEHYQFRCKIPREDWEFDTREFNSIVSEWDLVCDVAALSNLTKSLIFVGFFIGVLAGGVLSDKAGRKLLVYIPSLLGMLCALAASFTRAYWLYAFLRVVVGMCGGCMTICTFVLITEYAGKRHRHMAGTCLWFFWVFALMSLALLAYLIRDWRTLSIVASAPGLLQVVFWWFLPESSRWLLVHNKNEQVVEQLTKVAKFNRKEMPKGEIQLEVQVTRHGDFREMFSSAKMTRITLVSWFSWMVVAMVYYGVTFSSGEFGGNRYLVFFLTSIVEIPSNITAIVAMKRIGRKKTAVVGFVVSTVAALIALLLQRNMSDTGFLVGRIIMAQVIAKFFINMSFAAIYVYTVELFPTVIRNLGAGSSSAFGRIGSVAAPYIVWLVREHVLLPYSIMVAFSFLASVLCFFLLPETKNAPTPETMDAVNSSSGADVAQNGDLYSVDVSEEKEQLGALLLWGYWT